MARAQIGPVKFVAFVAEVASKTPSVRSSGTDGSCEHNVDCSGLGKSQSRQQEWLAVSDGPKESDDCKSSLTILSVGESILSSFCLRLPPIAERADPAVRNTGKLISVWIAGNRYGRSVVAVRAGGGVSSRSSVDVLLAPNSGCKYLARNASSFFHASRRWSRCVKPCNSFG